MGEVASWKTVKQESGRPAVRGGNDDVDRCVVLQPRFGDADRLQEDRVTGDKKQGAKQ